MTWAAIACAGGAVAPQVDPDLTAEAARGSAPDGAATVDSAEPGALAVPLMPATRVSARLGEQERAARQRGLTQQQPWDGLAPFRYVLEREREVAREHSLEGRASRRAFEGAPPVMPHSALFGDGTKTCLDCHTDGMQVGKRVARPMSHPAFGSCRQCHIESRSRELPLVDPVASTFSGRGPAQLAPSSGGPPMIPHELTMRTRCLSCHGEFGYPGLRTDHPQRGVCVQCHIVARR